MKTNAPHLKALCCSLYFFLTAANSVADVAVPGLKQQIPAAEYAALVDLYTSTQGGDPNYGWNDPDAPWWHGVTVSGFAYDPTTGQILSVGNVTDLQLLFSLSGNLPPSLGNLVKIQHLELEFNGLTGSIPDSLGNLVNLQTLDLGSNQLSGSIPESLGNLGHLQRLGLEFNELSGSIPESLGHLENLQYLTLERNQLSGKIPESLGNLTQLEGLSVSANSLSGNIPESLGNLALLSQLDLSGNQLSGSIPDFSATHLYSLGLFSNCFAIYPGSQLRTMVEKLSHTTVDYEPQNPGCSVGPGLKRQISEAEYTALVDLYTSTHGQTWTLKEGWNDPAAQNWYGVTVSGFEYDPATDQVLSVGTVVKITFLAGNGDRGNPLRGNNLSGKIPESLANLVHLQSLDLSRNALNGTIPENLGALVDLQGLSLGHNQLSGTIPESLGALVNLQRLDLGLNQLSGTIPESLGALVNLQGLDLGGNQLSGSIPESLGALVNLQGWLVLGRNQLSGTIPESLGKLVDLHFLDLGGNRLSGSIPETFGNLVNLVFLYLNDNQLSGTIPSDLINLLHLESFFIALNCFDISPGSEVRTIIHQMDQKHDPYVDFQPQRLGCGPVAFGDLNNDGCVDQTDLGMLMPQIRAHSRDLSYDLNHDGKVDIADARFLVLHFAHSDGSPCKP